MFVRVVLSVGDAGFRVTAEGDWSLPAIATTSDADDLKEGAAEVSHRVGVDEGIHSGVDVSEPREDWKEYFGMVDALLVTQSVADVRDEERHPTDAEDSYDDPQSLGRLLFLRHLTQFLLQRKTRPSLL